MDTDEENKNKGGGKSRQKKKNAGHSSVVLLYFLGLFLFINGDLILDLDREEKLLLDQSLGSWI